MNLGDQLTLMGKDLAALANEKFAYKHVCKAMDRLLWGSAYSEKDSLELKLQGLVDRAFVYIAFDRFLAAEKGQHGNLEIDSAIRRLQIFDTQMAIIERYTSDVNLRRMMFLSLMCRVNTLFLAREVLDKFFTFEVHAPVFDTFCIKDSHSAIEDQGTTKNRLILLPRGAGKSTADGCDIVSWIINFPQIRCLVLTAAVNLAKSFVGEVKSYFMPEDIDDQDTYTPFQTIFRADVRLEKLDNEGKAPVFNFLTADSGKETEFICPCRPTGDSRKREPTVFASSVGKNKAGFHADLGKLDDCTSDRNTETPELIEKTKRQILMALKLIEPSGHRDTIGTPYKPNDHIAHVRRETTGIATLIRPARMLRVAPDGTTAIDRGTHEKDLKPEDLVMLFPGDKHGRPRLSREFLDAAEREDEIGFPSQYLLRTDGYRKIDFSDYLLSQQTIPREKMPPIGQHFILWDLADTTTNQSDYSCGAVLGIDAEGAGYIADMYRDRYSISDLCYTIAQAHKTHGAVRTIIEDARGASKLEGTIRQKALDMGLTNISLEFVRVDNRKGSKSLRVARLEPLLRDRRLWFLNSLGCYEDLVKEFRDFGNALHDDIPDCIAHALLVLPEGRPGPVDPYAEQCATRIMESKAFYELIHNADPSLDYIDRPLDPLAGTESGGTGDGNELGDLWDPFSVSNYGRKS